MTCALDQVLLGWSSQGGWVVWST